MGMHRGLVEQDAALRVDAGGDQRRRHLAGGLRQRFRVVRLGDRVQIDRAVDALMIVLQFHPVAHRAQVVAEGGNTGGLDAREDALHGRGSFLGVGPLHVRHVRVGMAWANESRLGEAARVSPAP